MIFVNKIIIFKYAGFVLHKSSSLINILITHPYYHDKFYVLFLASISILACHTVNLVTFTCRYRWLKAWPNQCCNLSFQAQASDSATAKILSQIHSLATTRKPDFPSCVHFLIAICISQTLIMAPGKYFFIVSRMNGLVLDIEDENPDSGAS